jgi:hypothetical protein
MVLGDASISRALPGTISSPNNLVFNNFKQVARMLGTFPHGHSLAGQQRLLVLKIDEHLTRYLLLTISLTRYLLLTISQVPSCCHDHPQYPPGPNGCDRRCRLERVDFLYPVLRCRQCNRFWDRDVNAARFISYFNSRNIGMIYCSLRDHGARPLIYGHTLESF